MQNDAANNGQENTIPSWLACPLCRGAVSQVEDGFYCSEHDLVFPVGEGILQMLPPAEREDAADFAAEYR